MPNIAIIDDRKEHRETLKAILDTQLIEGWISIDISPLSRLEDYPSWITENEVSVILLDERLDEQIEAETVIADYRGHDLIDFVRGRFPTLPIYVITSYPNDDDLKERFKDVEEILPRDKFSEKAEDYVPRILRAGQKFLETFQEELAELSDKASKIAKGEATKEDIEKAKAIRTKIGCIFPSAIFGEHSQLLVTVDEKLKELEKLKAEVNKYFERKK